MDIPRWTRALRFASVKHKEQRRKDGVTPYINHPLEVVSVLAEQGKVIDEDLLIAALLHDTLEDTATTAQELSAAFGKQVCQIVQEVSDNKSLPKARRKELQIEHAPHLSPQAKQLKLADKICNLLDILTNPPLDWPLERQIAYFDWAEQVGAGLMGVNPSLEKIFKQTLARRIELRAHHAH
jgi:GTP diphosphokinase / guanosine-3',5'-bis(diphosphate) 3'-diphosphatase